MLNSSSAKWLGLLAGAAMTLLAFIGSVMLGTTPLEWSALWRMLTAYDPANVAHIILYTERLPRAVVAALVGTAVLWLTTPSRAADGAITGAVTSSNGPEAGVWVIAETTDLPTKFIKTVVTDGDGRYLVPDLPEASYKVWVRGYGLKDSNTVQAETGA